MLVHPLVAKLGVQIIPDGPRRAMHQFGDLPRRQATFRQFLRNHDARIYQRTIGPATAAHDFHGKAVLSGNVTQNLERLKRLREFALLRPV